MTTSVLEKQKQETKAVQQKIRCRAPIALYEDGESYIAIVELPGADEKAIQVRLEKGILTIEAPLAFDLPAEARQRYSEFRLGDYRRTLAVGDQIDDEKIAATFKNGLLKLMMPKSKAAQAKKIPITTA